MNHEQIWADRRQLSMWEEMAVRIAIFSGAERK